MKVAEQLGLQRLAAGVNNERIRLGIEIAPAVNRLRAERTIPHDDGPARMTAELDEDSGIRLLCGSDSDEDHERARRRARDLLAGTDGERRPFGRSQRATSARGDTHRNRQTAGLCRRISGCRHAVHSRWAIPPAGRRRTQVMAGRRSPASGSPSAADSCALARRSTSNGTKSRMGLRSNRMSTSSPMAGTRIACAQSASTSIRVLATGRSDRVVGRPAHLCDSLGQLF
jgi:hypothetical protein